MEAEGSGAEVHVGTRRVGDGEPGFLARERCVQDEMQGGSAVLRRLVGFVQGDVGQEVLGHHGHAGAGNREAALVPGPGRILLEDDGEARVSAPRQSDLQRLVEQSDAAARLPFVEGQVSVETEVQGQERAGQEGQDPDVRHHEARVVLLPRVPLHHRAEDVGPEGGEDEGEPPRAVHVALGGRGPVVHLVESARDAHGAQRRHRDHGEAERGQRVEDSGTDHAVEPCARVGSEKPSPHGRNLDSRPRVPGSQRPVC